MIGKDLAEEISIFERALERVEVEIRMAKEILNEKTAMADGLSRRIAELKNTVQS